MDNGKPIRESRDIDAPLVARHFYYHAGAAQLMDKEMADHRAIGVAGQVIPWNFPLLMLAWKIALALAMGNTVVLKPAEYTSLTALLFGEICREAGLPKGVVNLITGDGRVGEMLVTHQGIDKVAFTGSTTVGRRIRKPSRGRARNSLWNLEENRLIWFSMTPIWTVRSRDWWTPSGSTRDKSVAPDPVSSFRREWRRSFTKTQRPHG